MDTTNIEGTVCAYFLQEYSEDFGDSYTYCIENGIKNLVAVLCADGIMMRRRTTTNLYSPSLTKSLKKIGLDLVFVEKPMMQDIWLI
jgi:hypothetical protein